MSQILLNATTGEFISLSLDKFVKVWKQPEVWVDKSVALKNEIEEIEEENPCLKMPPAQWEHN